MATNVTAAGQGPEAGERVHGHESGHGGHGSVGGFCGVCGVVWPCSAARRAVLGLDGSGSRHE
jgi:hypothetical protein